MRRVFRLPVFAALSAFAMLLALAGPARASSAAAGPVLGLSGYYDYADSQIRDDAAGTVTDWWCGDLPGHTTDTILEEQRRISDGAVTLPERQVLAEGGAGSWDSAFTCNPSVVQGTVLDPFGDGLDYGYAMYYVGTADPAGHDNSIGAAFSNDGITWRKYPTPILTFPDTGRGYYGYAQPSATVLNGRVWLLFEDWDAPAVPGPGPVPTGTRARAALTTPGRQIAHAKSAGTSVAAVGTHWYTMSNPDDGVTFGGPALMTSSGLPVPTPSWGGAAYDPQDGRWYAAVNDDPVRAASTTGGIGERGQPGVTLYATDSLDTGVWSELDTIDTVVTGSESNFIAGLSRDPGGTLAASLLPSVQLVLSQSWPRPAYNASGTQLANAGAVNQWQIGQATWTPGQPLRTLQRVDYAGGHHEITTGWWDNTVYHLEQITLGKLAEAPTGAATVPLYSCKAGATDYFVSHQAGCEGQYKLGLEGYAYPSAAADRLPLYRCYTSAGHFVSTDPACEGATTEGLLGYSQN